MTNKQKEYAFKIKKTKSGIYEITFPQFPELASQGDNIQHCQAMAQECLSLYLHEEYLKDKLPEPKKYKDSKNLYYINLHFADIKYENKEYEINSLKGALKHLIEEKFPNLQESNFNELLREMQDKAEDENYYHTFFITYQNTEKQVVKIIKEQDIEDNQIVDYIGDFLNA